MFSVSADSLPGLKCLKLDSERVAVGICFLRLLEAGCHGWLRVHLINDKVMERGIPNKSWYQMIEWLLLWNPTSLEKQVVRPGHSPSEVLHTKTKEKGQKSQINFKNTFKQHSTKNNKHIQTTFATSNVSFCSPLFWFVWLQTAPRWPNGFRRCRRAAGAPEGHREGHGAPRAAPGGLAAAVPTAQKGHLETVSVNDTFFFTAQKKVETKWWKKNDGWLRLLMLVEVVRAVVVAAELRELWMDSFLFLCLVRRVDLQGEGQPGEKGPVSRCLHGSEWWFFSVGVWVIFFSKFQDIFEISHSFDKHNSMASMYFDWIYVIHSLS